MLFYSLILFISLLILIAIIIISWSFGYQMGIDDKNEEDWESYIKRYRSDDHIH
jgi:hypothetical protein